MGSLFTAARPIVLVGCGNMGKALLKGWLDNGIPSDAIYVVEPAGPDNAIEAGLPKSQVFAEAPTDLRAGILMAAVKPQIMADALPPVAHLIDEDTILLSIAAGTTLRVLKELTGQTDLVIRAMPNTPAAIGEGITVACPKSVLNGAQAAQVDMLLSAGGIVRWVDDEGDMDVVTAISGSGPAYVLSLIHI